MPYDLKEVAAISGMPGLYRLVKPTRAGVIIEALDEKGTRSVASARNKVSLLQEISIYTQDYDQTVPLTEVFDRIHQKHGADLALTHKSDDRDLTAFMGEIIPDYDRDRVYMSDIKKLVQWYNTVSKRLEYQAPAEDETDAPETTNEQKASKKTEADPTADEAMSTAGIIPAAEETNAAGNPEAGETKPAKKANKKKAE
ncbi:DUF5606 domain-containing protein [Hymenobacter sp. 5516J-16]|uniref:DUF5606 domain-containing protein n=1 Tax=Hymenobacter sublimis TaxID=2933777 RepID=A0ABY4JFK6_9BACT|nr:MULTISPECIES: DUF5606 domain-containing protein [Hymenobacter]UOQ77000.1 DUF5606 domain-containing protein [Hymenobacter sp. 5516J-16]UPL50682.1 DUF5606 domain-containing protein [Hymenobacter sublimis]